MSDTLIRNSQTGTLTRFRVGKVEYLGPPEISISTYRALKVAREITAHSPPGGGGFCDLPLRKSTNFHHSLNIPPISCPRDLSMASRLEGKSARRTAPLSDKSLCHGCWLKEKMPSLQNPREGVEAGKIKLSLLKMLRLPEKLTLPGAIFTPRPT